jgi:hypothetical protein
LLQRIDYENFDALSYSAHVYHERVLPGSFGPCNDIELSDGEPPHAIVDTEFEDDGLNRIQLTERDREEFLLEAKAKTVATVWNMQLGSMFCKDVP